ncbi:hypothetical protein HDU76_008873 [Blyttiomyces sp. JEL0837]|nr:hypothetical protein HDU76_008873 [Blyttiomyces sp. JEL0837]
MVMNALHIIIDWKGLADLSQSEPPPDPETVETRQKEFVEKMKGWRKYGLVFMMVLSGFVVMVLYPLYIPGKLVVEGAIAVYEKSKKSLAQGMAESRDPVVVAEREQVWNDIWEDSNEASGSVNEASALLNNENAGGTVSNDAVLSNDGNAGSNM